MNPKTNEQSEMSDVRTRRWTSQDVHIPPAAVDNWIQDLDTGKLSSGDFQIKQFTDGTAVALMRTGGGRLLDLGKHKGVRSAISACRCVAMALRSARSQGTDPEEPEEIPIGTSYAEKAEIEILRRQSQLRPDQSHTHIRRKENG